MIIGNINKETKEIKILPKIIRDSINYLKNTDFSCLENKKYVLKEDKWFVIIHEYETESRIKRKAEVHKKYIDIQFIISGEEEIGIGYENSSNKVFEDKLEENDYILYDDVKNERKITLSTGMYAIFFPEEIHCPGCDLNKKNKVRKAVIKIHLDELD